MRDDSYPRGTEDQSIPGRKDLEEELRSLLENVVDGYFACDAEWRFIHLDAKAESILGIRRDEVLGKGCWEILPATLGTMLEQEYRRAASGEARDFEFFYEPWKRWYHNRCFPLKEGGIAVFYHDITGRKRADEAARRSQERAQLLSRVMSGVLTASDPQAVVVDICNEVREFLHCAVFFNYLLDDKSRRLRFNACGGVEPRIARLVENLELSDSLCGTAAQSSCRVLAENLTVAFDGRSELVRGLGVHAYACHPLLGAGGKAFGTLAFGAADRDVFSEEDLSLMKAVSDHIAVAMLRCSSENAIRESESRFRVLMTACSDVVFRMSPDWGELLLLHGRDFVPDTDAPSQSYLEKYIHPDDRAQVLTAINGAIRSKSAFQLEHRVLRVDGSPGWAVSRAVPLLDENGEIFEWFGAANDITGRKEAEAELQRNRNLLDATQQIARVGGWEWDVDRQAMAWTDETFRIHGIRPGEGSADSKELIKRSLACYDPEDRPRIDAAFWRCVETGREYDLEVPFTATDGSRKWVRTMGQPEVVNGRIVKVLGNIMDITEHKQTEKLLHEALQQSEMMADFIRLSSQPFGLGYPDGTLGLVNPAFERLTGYSWEELKSIDWASVLTPSEWREHERQKLAELNRTGHPVQYEKEYIRKDGGRVPIELLAHLVTDAEGKPEYYYSFLTDITERKMHERELEVARQAAEEANRAKSRFLANMSHEIRTPINGIMGMAQLLGYTEMTDEQQECLDALKTCSNSLLALINDVLDLARIESGKVELEKRDFSLRASISDVITTQITLINNKGLSIHTDIPVETPDNLNGDQLRLKQILLNFLSNAVKFTDSGRICISASVTERQDEIVLLKLGVTDTGIGISAEAMEKIFKPFTQADVSTSRKYGGTGLGLSICAQLAELMGGRIWAESTEGTGSAFFVQVPFVVNEAAVERHTRRGSDKARTLWNGPPLTILVAEDMAINMITISRLLQRNGHSVLQALDGAEALQKWEEGGVDLILMDIQMPVMSGIEAIRVIRGQEQAAGGHVPIIALTGRALGEERNEIMSQGFDGYVAKPVELALLFDEMWRCLPETVLKTVKKGRAPPEATQCDEAHIDKDRFKVLLVEIEAMLKSSNMAVIEKVSELVKSAPSSGSVKTLKGHVKKCNFSEALTCLPDIYREFAIPR